MHEGHSVKYIMTDVTVEHDAVITPDGNVKVIGDMEVLRIDGDTFVYCDTCNCRVISGEEGLGDEWQVQ